MGRSSRALSSKCLPTRDFIQSSENGRDTIPIIIMRDRTRVISRTVFCLSLLLHSLPFLFLPGRACMPLVSGRGIADQPRLCVPELLVLSAESKEMSCNTETRANRTYLFLLFRPRTLFRNQRQFERQAERLVVLWFVVSPLIHKELVIGG